MARNSDPDSSPKAEGRRKQGKMRQKPPIDAPPTGFTAAPNPIPTSVEEGLPANSADRKETENRLAYLASFPQRNPNPIMEVDLDGDIRFVNPAAMRLFPDLGERGTLHPWLADWAAVVAPFREGRSETGLRDVTVGDRTWQQAFYYSAENRFVRIYGFDVTERSQAEQALQQANEQLQAQSKELTTVNEELQAQQEELQAQAEELRETEQALRLLNEELEQRVAARTAELSKANDTMQAERQRFNAVLETLPAYLVLLTPDHHVPFANRFFRERFGESNGKRCFEYLFNRTEPCEICETYKVLETDKPHHWEWTGPDERDYDIYDFPFTDTDGSPLIMEMGIDITERKRAEAALKEANERLEQRVAERTAALQEANEQLRIQSEQLQAINEELNAQTEELAAQEEELRTSNEELRQRERALADAKERWERTFDSVPDLIAILDDRHKVLQANRAMAKRLGLTPEQCIGLPCHQVVHGTDAPPAFCPHARTLKDGCEHVAEFHEERLEGDFLVSTTPLHDGNARMIGSVHVARDITELKQTEEILRQNEAMLRAVLDQMPSGVTVRDAQTGRLVLANARSREIKGALVETTEEFAEYRSFRPDGKPYRPEDWPVARSIRTGETVDLEEVQYERDDGTRVMLSIRSAPIRDSQGQIVMGVGVFHDITERKRREARIARLTSLYAVLSRANEAIVRTHDEQPLFDEVCRIVAEEGGFPLVWIGQVDGRQVVPVAWSGPGREYLEQIKVEIDGELGRGPTGTCIREDHAVINDDFATNPTMSPWRQAALQHSFRASAAFPLRRGGKVAAALTLYAPQPGVFDAEQVALLESLAADLSYALDAIEQERAGIAARQKLAEQAFLLANVGDGVIGLDLDYRITFWGAAAERMYGYTEAEAMGKSSLELLQPVYLGRTREEALARLTSTGRLEAESVQQTKSGNKLNIESYSLLLHDNKGQPCGIVAVNRDITERKRVEEALRQAHAELRAQSEELQAANDELREQEQALQVALRETRCTAERLRLLSDTAAGLLAADDPQATVETLCRRVMKYLDCDAFFNFLVDERAGRLRLNACAGIPKEERRKIEWLDYGGAVCRCVARDGKRIIAEHIPDSEDERTALVKSYGIKAYACHPIVAGDQVLGTLSFGTKTRETFGQDDLSLMNVVVDMVAIAVQRQQIQQALRASEQRLKHAQEIARLGSWELDLATNRLTWSDEVYRIFGLTPQEFGATYEAFLERVHPEDRTPVDTAYSTSLREDRDSYEIEHRIIRKNTGEIRVVHEKCEHFRDAAGNLIRSVGMVHDITERKKMETQLRQLNEQLEEKVAERTERLMTTVDRLQDEVARRVLAEGKLRRNSRMLEGFFQHTITPLAFLDANFRFVRVNEAYAKADGKSVDYFTGRNHFDLYPHDENRAIFEQVVKTKEPFRAYAKPFVYPDDPQRVTYWNWQLTPLLSESGTVESLVLNLEDVTKQQRAYQELERRARQLQHLALELSQAEDRERRRLAEILHDDLQQILAAAKFHLGILGGRIRADKSLREIIEQLNQMLKEAIDKSRSLSHELSPAVLYHGNLGETCEWLAQQVRAKHGLQVNVEVRDRVDANSEALKAFLYRTAQEMLFNVIKHAKSAEATLRLQRVRDQIWLTISDRGRGFDPRTLGRAAGFGLLSIRERVLLLGGRMKIRSAVGGGSTFLIAVPDPELVDDADAQDAVQGEQTADATTPDKHAGHKTEKRLRVLLVDDHEVMREGLAALLDEHDDIEVVGQAGNGREAVTLAYEMTPDVIIMDSSMPVMGGDEATRQIKRHSPQVRIIALSMFDEPQISRKMRAAGAEVYLLKTAPSEELLAAIRGRSAGRNA
jgi:PAS domain S-box-containing protein